MKLPETVKKHWPIFAGGAIGLGLLWWMVRGKTNANAAALAAQAAYGPTQYIPVAGGPSSDGTPSQVAAQLASDQLQAQINASNQQNEIAYISALGDLTGKVSTGVAQIYAAENALPAAAITAASNQNQVALSASAATAVQSMASLPGLLDSAAKLTAASYLPVASYAEGIAGIANTVATSGSNAVNSASQSMQGSANAAASSAGQAAAANASSTSSTMEAVGSVAMIALMLL